MNLQETLRAAAWLVCGIYATIPCYWLMVHPFAASWRARRHRLKTTLLPLLWMTMWCAAWALTRPWSQMTIYGSGWSWAGAVPFWAISLSMYTMGTRGLSLKRVIGWQELEARPNDVLVTGGMHRMVRHPLYLGHLCTMLGFTIGAGTAGCAALLAFALAAGPVMIWFEERELHQRFGASWEEYRKRTPAIVPRLG